MKEILRRFYYLFRHTYTHTHTDTHSDLNSQTHSHTWSMVVPTRISVRKMKMWVTRISFDHLLIYALNRNRITTQTFG